MSRRRRAVRYQVTPDEKTRERVAAIARKQGQPTASVVAQLVRHGLDYVDSPLAAAVGDGSGPRERPRVVGNAGPPWVPASDHVDAIERLRAAFPNQFRELRHLSPEEYLADEYLALFLSALAAWRTRIDSGEFQDSRVELAFLGALDGFSGWLRDNARQFRPIRRGVGYGG